MHLWLLNEIELFPENYNLSSEIDFCLRCGHTFQDFLKSGKIGCGQCFESFRSALIPYKKIEFKYQKKRLKNFAKNRKSFFREIQDRIPIAERKIFQAAIDSVFSDERQGVPEIEKKIFRNFPDSRISFRYRVARNLSGVIYPTSRLVVGDSRASNVKAEIFKTLHLPVLGGGATIGNPVRPTENSNLVFFDEDHVRFEIYSRRDKFYEYLEEFSSTLTRLNSKEIFDFHPRAGFIAACPTNTGRGNKLSVYLDFQNFNSSDEILIGRIIGDTFDYSMDFFLGKDGKNRRIRLYLYKKNIREDQIQLFYEFVYFLLQIDQNRKILK